MKWSRSLKISVVVFALFLPIYCQAPSAGNYDALVALNNEYLEFVKPKLVDGVPDYSADTMKAQKEGLEKFRSRLTAINPDSWPIPQKVDYLVVNARFNQLDFEHRVTQLWARDPAFYMDLERRMVRYLPYTEVPIPSDEQAEFQTRLKRIPKILEQGQANLTKPSAEFAKIAIFLLNNYDGVGQGEPVREVPPAGTIGWYLDLKERLSQHHPDMVADAEAAHAAVEDYSNRLKATLDSMTEPVYVGLDNFNWYLKNVRYAPYTAKDVALFGEREMARWRTFLKIEENKNEHRGIPPLELASSKEEYDQRVRKAERQIRTLLKEQELLTLPPDTPAEFETDAHWRAGHTLHFWEELQFRNPLNNHIHASIPGHRFDGFMRTKVTNPIRATYGDGSRAEGWGVYIEEMFLQAGLMDEIPRARELFYIALMKRAGRVNAEIGMHSGKYTLDQANQYLMENVPFMEPNLGRYDLQGYLRRPTGGSHYLMGYVMMEKLISDRAKQLGDEFKLGAFHDEFHTLGMIPMPLIRWEMTGLDDEVKEIWATVGKKTTDD